MSAFRQPGEAGDPAYRKEGGNFVKKEVSESVISHISDALKRDGFSSVERSESGALTDVTAEAGDVELNLKLNAPSDFVVVRVNVKIKDSDGNPISDAELTARSNEIRDDMKEDKAEGYSVSGYDGLLVISTSLSFKEDAASRDIFFEIMTRFNYILGFVPSLPTKIRNAFRKQGNDPFGFEAPEKKKPKPEKKPEAKPKTEKSQKKEGRTAETAEKKQPEKQLESDDGDDLSFMFDDDSMDLFADNFGEDDQPEEQPEENTEETEEKEEKTEEKEMEKPEAPAGISSDNASVESELDALLNELNFFDDEPKAEKKPERKPEKKFEKKSERKPNAFKKKEKQNTKPAPAVQEDSDISRQKAEMYDEIDEIFARKRKEADEREARLDSYSERLSRREQNLERKLADLEKECDQKISEAQSKANRIVAEARKTEKEAKEKNKKADLRLKQAKEVQATADRSMKNAQEEKDIIEREKKYCIEKEDAEKIISENEDLKRKVEDQEDTIRTLRSSGASAPSLDDAEKYKEAIALLMDEKEALKKENAALKAGAVPAVDEKTKSVIRAAKNKIEDLNRQLEEAKSAAPSAPAASSMTIDDVKSVMESSDIDIAEASVEGDEDEPVYVARTDSRIFIAINVNVRVIYVKVTPKRIGTLKKKIEDLNKGDIRVSYATVGKDVIAKYAFTDAESLKSGLEEIIEEAKAMQ